MFSGYYRGGKTQSTIAKLSALIKIHHTTWKVFKYGVFSRPCFLAFGLNTEICRVNLLIQFKYRKIRTRKNFVFGHFSRSANFPGILRCFLWYFLASWENNGVLFYLWWTFADGLVNRGAQLSGWVSWKVHRFWIYFLQQSTWILGRMNLFNPR